MLLIVECLKCTIEEKKAQYGDKDLDHEFLVVLQHTSILYL